MLRSLRPAARVGGLRLLRTAAHSVRGHAEPAAPIIGSPAEDTALVQGSRITADPVGRFLAEHAVAVKGATQLQPFLDFAATPFSARVRRALAAQGYEAPTPIQALAWSLACAKRDLIAVAKTGSGKTCGFLLPAMHMLEAERASESATPSSAGEGRGASRSRLTAHRAPAVLVLAPTRELAVQIEKEARQFTGATGLSAGCLYGGTSRSAQVDLLRRGLDVVIGTPGRCNDLAEAGALNLSKVRYLVLDEADRMLDMGFEPQIRQIIEQMPVERQSLFFTATWPREVQSLAADFLSSPVQINIGAEDALNANSAIEQHVQVVAEYDKGAALLDLLERLRGGADKPASALPRSLIFVARKDMCDDIAYDLHREGYATESIHGDKSQDKRTRAMDNFRSGKVRILVATDVASRGIDVKDIASVVNYDFPEDVETYVHRIGRTGRAGAGGSAYSFFTRANASCARELVGVMQRCGQKVPADLSALVRSDRSGGGPKRGGGRGGGRFGSRPASRSSERFGGGRSGGFGRDRFGGADGYGGRPTRFEERGRGGRGGDDFFRG